MDRQIDTEVNLKGCRKPDMPNYCTAIHLLTIVGSNLEISAGFQRAKFASPGRAAGVCPFPALH